MQLLIQIQGPDFASWQADFQTDAENIAAAGLTVLQIWTAEGGAIFVLFTVANRKRAQEWLANQAATGHSYTSHFLETAL